MSGCCPEYNCRRKVPILIYKGDLSDTIYAVTDSRPVTGYTRAATRRHVITEQVERFIRANPEWVRSVLEPGDSP